MIDQLSKHPSNIAKSALEYLETLQVAERTRKKYEEVLFLFVESLCWDSSAITEGDDGEYLLCNNWDAYYGGVISGFVDWWLPRRVMSNTLQTRAPGVLRKWLKWCFEEDYFDEERYQDFQEALPRGKTKEVQRVQEAGELLYRLHTPNPGAWMTGDSDRVVSIGRKSAPEEWDEGYMKVVRLGKTSGYLENEEGTEYGPVLLSEALANVLKVGDVMNVSLGKFGKSWKVLESGNVYAEDTGFF